MHTIFLIRRFFSVICAAFICSLALPAKAQYYYKDIVITGQINAGYKLLKENKVLQVTLIPAALAPGQNSVSLQQTVYPQQQLVITHTRVPDATESWLKSYYNEQGLLIKAVDSSAEVVTVSLYTYDASARPLRISSSSLTSRDPAETELHQWIYNSNGLPVQLVKIKNNTDTTLVSFTADEQQNIAEEKAVHEGSNTGTIYYYYDAQHRLTDVARFNQRANRILPDYMFAYNNAGQLSQMIVVPEGSADYQTWKYFYTPQGLKEKDECYSKQKQMVASIAYQYAFGK